MNVIRIDDDRLLFVAGDAQDRDMLDHLVRVFAEGGCVRVRRDGAGAEVIFNATWIPGRESSEDERDRLRAEVDAPRERLASAGSGPEEGISTS